MVFSKTAQHLKRESTHMYAGTVDASGFTSSHSAPTEQWRPHNMTHGMVSRTVCQIAGEDIAHKRRQEVQVSLPDTQSVVQLIRMTHTPVRLQYRSVACFLPEDPGERGLAALRSEDLVRPFRLRSFLFEVNVNTVR